MIFKDIVKQATAAGDNVTSMLGITIISNSNDGECLYMKGVLNHNSPGQFFIGTASAIFSDIIKDSQPFNISKEYKNIEIQISLSPVTDTPDIIITYNGVSFTIHTFIFDGIIYGAGNLLGHTGGSPEIRPFYVITFNSLSFFELV